MALRHFGSKSWLKEKLPDLIPKDTKILVSPFLGSGKAELHLAKTRPDIVAMGSDLFEPLVNFHQKLQDGSLFEPLQAWVDASLSKEEHTKLLASMDSMPCDQRAAAFFMIMRNSFHGKFGSYYEADKLTKRTIEMISRQRLPNFHVDRRDAFETIRDAPDGAVIFADPP